MNKKSKLQMIPTDKLHPHPDNPRKVIGDVSELAESIKANGILQNLTVVPNNDNWDDFTVIIGHRRLAAAKQAGLTELPCAVVEMTEKEQLSTMLTENMQRSDLTVYEEAKGCQLLLDLGDTVAEVAEKTGFSESKIRRRVKLCELDEEAFKESQIRQPTLQDYDRLNKIEDIEERNALLKTIGTNNFNSAIYAAEAKQERKHTRDEIKKVCSDKGLLECETSGAPKGYKYEGCHNLSTLKDKSFDDGKKRMYYMSAYSNDISVYVEITKDDKIKADEESAKRESERQTLKELRERGNEIDDRCEALREGFMLDANFNDSDSKRNLIAYIMYAMSANSGYDDAALLKIAGLKYDEGECINLDDCLADTGKTLMAMAYAFFSGFHDSSYIDFSYYEGVTRNINPELNRFYNLLCKLGYVMSDEEIQLRDGTHPIFTSGEVK